MARRTTLGAPTTALTGRRGRSVATCVAALALAGLAAALSGCGIAAQSAPQPLDLKSEPAGLTGANSPPRTVVPWLDVPVTVYLAGRDDHLEAVKRDVAAPATLVSVLDQLAFGPTERQSQRGLVSPASSVGPVKVGPLRKGIVEVDLPKSFENLDGQDQTVAAAQVVFTATAVPGVRGVLFRLGGQPAQVPDENGHITSGPSVRKDYADLAG